MVRPTLFVNNKKQTIYKALGYIINATNANDGDKMVLYTDINGTAIYTREAKEFFTKFTSYREVMMSKGYQPDDIPEAGPLELTMLNFTDLITINKENKTEEEK